MIDFALLDLYSQRLKALGALVKDDQPLPVGQLPVGQAQATLKRRSPLCGSQLTLDVRLDEVGRVVAIGWKARCCALAAAATAIVITEAPGKTLADFQRVRQMVADLLQDEDAVLPEGAWPDLEVLAPAAMVPSRHGSTLLAFETLIAAVSAALEAQKATAST